MTYRYGSSVVYISSGLHNGVSQILFVVLLVAIRMLYGSTLAGVMEDVLSRKHAFVLDQKQQGANSIAIAAGMVSNHAALKKQNRFDNVLERAGRPKNPHKSLPKFSGSNYTTKSMLHHALARH